MILNQINCPLLSLLSAGNGEREFCYTSEGAVSVISFLTLVSLYFQYFSSLNFNSSTRVLVLLPTHVNTLALIWALLWGGYGVCLMNPKAPLEEAVSFLSPVYVVDAFPNLSGFEPKLPSERLLCLDQLATFIQTSGSSGYPKWVVHSLRQHRASALASLDQIPFSFPECWLLSLPLYHVSGLSIFFRAVFSSAALALSASISEGVLHFPVTHASLVSAQLLSLLDSLTEPLSSLKFLLMGGGPVDESVFTHSFLSSVQCFTTYGCTETASQIITNHHVLPHLSIKSSSFGSLCVKGESLCLGYFFSPDLICLPLDDEGYFDTLDVFSYSHSKYHISGRLDRQFISGGENIYPEEIERIALKSGFSRQAVVVKTSDSRFGFRPVLYTDSLDSEIPLLLEYLHSHLVYFKVPVSIFRLPISFLGRNLKLSYTQVQMYHNKFMKYS